MEISKHKSWKMMHSTMNTRPFLLMLMDIRFSSFEGRLGVLSMKLVMLLNSLTVKMSSVSSKLESEIRLLYCVKRLFTRISFLSLVKTPSPSREVCRWVMSFSRSMYSASLVSRTRL